MIILAIPVFFLGLLIALVLFKSKENKDKKEDFLFQVTPAKKCCGGIYKLGGSDTCTSKYCDDPANKDTIDRMCCGKGYIGRKLQAHQIPDGYDYTKSC